MTTPLALARIGLGHRTELRLGTDGFATVTSAGVRTSGSADVEVGLKVRLLDQSRAGIDMALIPMASLPTGSQAFSSNAIDPTVKVTFARSVPAGFDLTGNVNVAGISDGHGRFVQNAVSILVGHDLIWGLGGFLESYRFSELDRGGTPATTIDWGVSHSVGLGMQADIEAGRGVSAAAPDWFVGFGFAIKRRRP